ncbi:MAG TPA: hypothetical protein PKE06_07245 [Flavilitoribacter sp.]|nr:hypothetical protein [Flavilitoribacter sp.]HMQ87485.1 hypothetical protein [Flavilitoribacter sp.]
MKKTGSCLILLCLAGMLLMSRCKESCDDPTDMNCPNYDPCLSYEPADADFMILDSLTGWVCDGELFGLITEVDSLFVPNDLIFRAKHENDTYTWKVGTDARTWTEQSFSLDFGINGTGDIPVTLVVSKDDPYGCLTEEERTDSLTKTVHLYSWNSHNSSADTAPPIIGRYFGANEDAPSDTFTLEILGIAPVIGVINLPKDCPSLIEDLVISNRSFLFATGDSKCGKACGTGILQGDNLTFMVDYSLEIDGIRKNKKFLGTKIK